MYRLDGLKIYQGAELLATAANPAAADRLLQLLNGDDAEYAQRVLAALCHTGEM